MPLIFQLISLATLLLAVLGAIGAIHYLRNLQLPRRRREISTVLILPASGELNTLDCLLSALAWQTMLPARLVISVESVSDPAYQRAASLTEGWPFPIDLVVAGEATACGQKCKNQIAALEWLESSRFNESVIVFLDADILPGSGWLSALVSPIANNSADMVSGYRWQFPEEFSLGGHLIAAIDRGIAMLPRPPGSYLAWGGSLAVSRVALERLDIKSILGNTLSDDCALGKAAGEHGLRFLVRRALLVPTPAQFRLMEAWRFGRRQYQIVRIHCASIWVLAAMLVGLRALTWVILAIHYTAAFSFFIFVVLLAAALVGRVTQQRVAVRLGQADKAHAAVTQMGLIFMQPVVDLFHMGIILSSSSTRRIVWGHVTYDAQGPQAVAIIARVPWRTR